MDGLVNYGLLRPENVNAFQTGLIQGEDRRNALAQQQQQRQLTDIQLQNALREQRMAGEEEAAYKAAGSDLNRLQAELMQRGLGKQGLAVGAQLQQQRTAKLTELKATAEVLKREASAVVAEPTIANAVGRLQAFSKATGADVSADLQQVMALGENPEAIRRWAAGHAMEADKLLPKFERFDQGSAVVTGAVNPLTGEFTPGTAFQKGMAPGEAARLGMERARLSLSQREAEEKRQGIAQTVTDEAGNVRFFDRQGREIKPTAVTGEETPLKGKPSAQFEKTRAQRAQMGRDLDMAISELSAATAEGGLIDQSTGSGAGRALDVAAGFVGQATPGAIAIAKLKPIADLALKMVPRFEGPQSDKDTQSYKEAAGQLADPSLPTKIRKEAGKTVLRLMQARKDQFVSPDMAAEGTAPGGAGIDALLDKYK